MFPVIYPEDRILSTLRSEEFNMHFPEKEKLNIYFAILDPRLYTEY